MSLTLKQIHQFGLKLLFKNTALIKIENNLYINSELKEKKKKNFLS